MINELLNGAGLSLELAILALSIGFAISVIFTYLLATKKKVFSVPINTFITFTRGVPLLVQIFLLYYGAAEFEWVRNSVFWPILQEPFCCATIVLALNSSAYTTVLLTKAINSIPIGEIEVCKTLNLSFYQTWKNILWPRALSNIWSAYSNEAIMVLKSTSLASTITLIDLMGAARQEISTHYKTFEVLLITAALYLVLAWFLLIILAIFKKTLKISSLPDISSSFTS